MKTAEEIIKEIEKDLSNEERWKLLEIMYDKYYNKDKYFEGGEEK